MSFRILIQLVFPILLSSGCVNSAKFERRVSSVNESDVSGKMYIRKRAQAHSLSKVWPVKEKTRAFGYITSSVDENRPPDMIEVHENVPLNDLLAAVDQMEEGVVPEGIEIQSERPVRHAYATSAATSLSGKILQNLFANHIRVFPGETRVHKQDELKKFRNVETHSSLTFAQSPRFYKADFGQVKAAETLQALDRLLIKYLPNWNEEMKNSATAFASGIMGRLPGGERASALVQSASQVAQELQEAIQIHTLPAEIHVGLVNDDGYSDLVMTKLLDVHIELGVLRDFLNSNNASIPGYAQIASLFENYVSRVIPGFALDMLTSDGALGAMESIIAPIGIVSVVAVFHPEKGDFEVTGLPRVQAAVTENLQDVSQVGMEDLLGGFAEKFSSQELRDLTERYRRKDSDLTFEEYVRKKYEIISYVHQVRLGDLNRDKRDELILVKKEGKKIEVYSWENRSSEDVGVKFADRAELWSDHDFLRPTGFGQEVPARSVHIADMNGDGYSDVVLMNEHVIPFTEMNYSEGNEANGLKRFVGWMFSFVRKFSDKTPFWTDITIRTAFRNATAVSQGNSEGAFSEIRDGDQVFDEREPSSVRIPFMPGYSHVDSMLFGDVEGQGCSSYVRVGNYAPDSPWSLPNPMRTFMDRMMTYNTTDCQKVRQLHPPLGGEQSYKVYSKGLEAVEN